jgi:apolipoprotein N-acyltransferase
VGIAFAGSAAIALVHHAQYATGRRPREFFAFLETSGWLTLTLATGVALFRLASGVLSVSAGAVGVLFVLVGALLRAPDRG